MSSNSNLGPPPLFGTPNSETPAAPAAPADPAAPAASVKTDSVPSGENAVQTAQPDPAGLNKMGESGSGQVEPGEKIQQGTAQGGLEDVVMSEPDMPNVEGSEIPGQGSGEGPRDQGQCLIYLHLSYSSTTSINLDICFKFGSLISIHFLEIPDQDLGEGPRDQGQ